MVSAARPQDRSISPIQRIDGSDLRHNQRAVANLIGRQSTRFPGAQPITFTRSDLDDRLFTDFLVCQKTDGVRHLLYLGTNQSDHGMSRRRQFLIDRKNQYYSISESFSITSVERSEQDSTQDIYLGTLLDGELVRQEDGRQSKWSYLIFDCLALNGSNMTGESYDIRMKSLGVHFHSRWKAGCSLAHDDALQSQPWSLCLFLKIPQPFQKLKALLQDDTPNPLFANDGLIFTSKNAPYICGTSQYVLKWKRPEDMTIDFLVQPWHVKSGRVVRKRSKTVEITRQCHLYIHSGNSDHHYFAPLSVTEAEYDCIERQTRRSESTILECFKDKQTGLWRPKIRPDSTLLFREDKARANHISVVEDIVGALQDAVTERDLVNFVVKSRLFWASH